MKDFFLKISLRNISNSQRDLFLSHIFMVYSLVFIDLDIRMSLLFANSNIETGNERISIEVTNYRLGK